MPIAKTPRRGPRGLAKVDKEIVRIIARMRLVEHKSPEEIAATLSKADVSIEQITAILEAKLQPDDWIDAIAHYGRQRMIE